jgi:hypothetical protein
MSGIPDFTWLRLTVINHPLALWLAVFLALSLLFRGPLSRSPQVQRLGRIGPVWMLLAALGAFVAMAGWYVRSDRYLDQVEPGIAAVSWAYEQGQALYHSGDSAYQYSPIYGPLVYILTGGFMQWVGPSLTTSKIPGVVAVFVGLVALWRATKLPFRTAAVLCGFVSVLYLGFRNISFSNRPDPFVLCFVSVAVLGLNSRSPLAQALIVGVAAGLTTGFKVSSAIYFLPVFFVLWVNVGVFWSLVAFVAGAAVTLAPFALSERISLSQYMAGLAAAGTHGLRIRGLPSLVEWFVFLLLPLAWAGARLRRCGALNAVDRALIVGSVLAGVIGLVPALKPGSSTWHLLPIVPLAAWGVARAWRSLPMQSAVGIGGAAYVCVAVLIAGFQQAYFIRTLPSVGGTEVHQDIQELVHREPRRVMAMGYGVNYRLSDYRALLVFWGNPYVLDAPALMDRQQAGLPTPAATVELIQSCRVGMWLVPRGNAPFEVQNYYDVAGREQLFSQSFREAFNRTHRLGGQTRFYDLWVCG